MNNDNLQAAIKLAATGTTVIIELTKAIELDGVMSYLEDQGFPANVKATSAGWQVLLGRQS